MANQIIIDIGAVANDGTGDPLRTAFGYVNNNFSNIWATGVANSNISFSGNKILTTNTNGNLVLAPNGIGKVQANVDIVPNANNTLSLGSLTNKWNTVYTQYLEIGGELTTNDLTVDGNLTVTGNIIQIGNLVTDAKTIQLANTASTANAANGSGITVGANDNIATMLYSSTSNVWTMNIGLTATGNIAAPYFVGNGALLTGITSYGNSNVAAYLPTYTGNLAGNRLTLTDGIAAVGNIVTDSKTLLLANIANTASEANGAGILVGFNLDIAGLTYNSTSNAWLSTVGLVATGNIRATNTLSAPTVVANTVTAIDNLFATVGTFTGDSQGENSIYAGVPLFTVLGSDVVAQFSANVDAYSQFNFQNGNAGAQASGDYVITADNGTDSTHFLNIGITSSNWDGTQPNSLGNRLGPNDGYLYVQDGDMVIGTSNGNIETWKFGQDGTLTAPGNIVPDASNVYSLGTTNNRWSNLYLSGNTIVLGDLSLSAGADGLTSTAGFDLGNSIATDITSEILTANIAVNIGTGGISIGDDNFLVVETLVPGGLRPSNDDMYLLGNISHRWSEVHANVYYGDGSQLTGIAATGNLEIVGASITIAPGAPEEDIFITPSGESWAFLQLPVNDTANVTNTRLHNDAGNVEIGAGDLSNGGNSYEWTFGKDGNLYLPNNGDLNFNAGGIVQEVDEDFTILVQDADDDGFKVQLNVDDGAGTTLSSYQQQRDRFEFRFSNGNNFSFNDNNRMLLPPAAEIWTEASGNASIIARSVDATSFIELMTQDNSDIKRSNVTVTRDTVTVTTGSGAYNWAFGVDGNLTTPGDIHVGNGVAAVEYSSGGNRITITSDTGNNLTGASFTLNADANVYANANVKITSDSGTTAKEWVFDNTGNLFVPGNIVANDTILIDNRESGVIADISIYSADNILLQGADRTNPGEPEGGDISILAGAGAADSGPGDASGGGDILIEGGSGGAANVYSGASGGFIAITAGRGGDGSVANAAGVGGSIEISAGDGGSDNGSGGEGGGSISLLAGDSTDTTQDRGSITLISGSGGDETTAGGYVEINIPSVGTSPGGSWIFTGTGTVLETPNNAEIFNVNAGNLTVGSAGNTIVRTIGAGLTTYDWVFDPTGDLIVPGGNTEIYVANAVGNVAGNSISITGGDADQTAYYATPGGNVNISGGLGAFNDGGGGGQGGSVNITAGASADPAGVAGNVVINTGGANTWTFDNTGNLTSPGNISGNTAGYAIGYRDIPQVSFTGNATIATTDAGKHYYSTESSNYTLTIANNASQGFQVGAAITVINQGTGTMTIGQGSGVTLYLAGNATSGNRSVATFGMATLIKVATDTWFINGTGVS